MVDYEKLQCSHDITQNLNNFRVCIEQDFQHQHKNANMGITSTIWF